VKLSVPGRSRSIQARDFTGMDTASVGLVRRVENMVSDTPHYRLLHGTGEVERQAAATYRGAVRAIAALDPIIERCTGSPGRAGTLPDPDATVVR